ncbi:MAG: non-heme iron oxygenase ferredoxin subunit [Pseudomonadota bacterium]
MHRKGAMVGQSGSEIVKLCDVNAVPDGEIIAVCVGGQTAVAVINLAGTFYAISNACTHGDGELSDGFVDDDVVVCPVHAGEFHVPTGKAMDLPVTEDVQTFAVWIEGENVMADLSRPAEGAAAST